jgi:hypothetical protein
MVLYFLFITAPALLRKVFPKALRGKYREREIDLAAEGR